MMTFGDLGRSLSHTYVTLLLKRQRLPRMSWIVSLPFVVLDIVNG